MLEAKGRILITILSIVLCQGENGSEEVRRKLCPPMPNVKSPVNRQDTSSRIKKLRETMHDVRSVQGPALDAYIISRYDEHMNEYVADRDKRLEFISGFTGGRGMAVVTKNKLIFWTDEVYSTQAENELSCNWTIYKTSSNSPGAVVGEWLVRELQSGMRAGADPKLVPNTEWEVIARTMTVPSKSILLLPIVNNLIDFIWPDEERAPESASKTWREKLNLTREHLKMLDVDAIVITSLSEIAWLLNIRGFDLPYGPFLKAYVIVTKDQLHLYTAADKLDATLHSHLYTNSCVSAYCTRLHEYDSIWNDLRKLSQHWKRVLLPSMSHFSAGVSRQIFTSVALEKRKALPSPIITLMAEKNEKERIGMRNAYIHDAITLSNFSAYLEIELERTAGSLDEMALANLTYQTRVDNVPMFRGLSYPPVIATGSNTAIPMYVPTNATNKVIEGSNLLIIDSGAHYLGGTTSSARTFLLEATAVTDDYVNIYTRVLSGLINLARFSFPAHLTTSQLDIIARTELWEIGLDYPHGSGHGIGVFSNVYESPVDMYYKNGQNTTLKVGYLILLESGYYKEDQYGIRLSCTVEVVYTNNSSGYLSFQPLSLLPFEHVLINYTMLSIQQKIWLNEYNARIREIIGEDLKNRRENNAFNWVFDRTKEIPLDNEEEENSSSVLRAGSSLQFFIFVMFIFRFVATV
ncbi:hypothetical protein V9T40_014828 [Parthenolecanium corni]|uniref:Xaa-Pro aminopeptidase 1 n=1 Tax=Parthenolecanium corni TaxID=536013 RepID=A0AAN9TH84_9HEMI